MLIAGSVASTLARVAFWCLAKPPACALRLRLSRLKSAFRRPIQVFLNHEPRSAIGNPLAPQHQSGSTTTTWGRKRHVDGRSRNLDSDSSPPIVLLNMNNRAWVG